ncbi:MAG: beta-ketoacyl-ACP synthase III [Caldilineaceae bacterium]
MAERTNGYHNGDTPLADSVHAPPAPEAAPREAEPMLGRRYAQIVGWGYHVPEKIITNHDLEQIVDTSDEWIRSRTGIEQRHVAADPSETTASLGVLAARKALAVADVHPSKLDLIIVATSSPEHIFPSTASIVQDALGATNAGAFDLSAACSGFVYGLSMARGHILAGDAEYVLVVGAETLSRIVDWTDRNTCILFGDGAGAVLLAASDVPGGILAVDLGSDGSGADLLAVPAGGSRMPASLETVSNGSHYMVMDGKAVFRFATSHGHRHRGCHAQGRAGHRRHQSGHPHQANVRIIQNSVVKQLKLGEDSLCQRATVRQHQHGQHPHRPVRSHRGGCRVASGDNLVFVGFGAGLSLGRAR